MPLALVVAPSDPQAGDGGARRESLAWLRGKLSRFGFHVVIVGGGEDPDADVERAAACVSPGDTVLVHASGRLTRPDRLCFGGERSIPLQALRDAVAARGPAHVSFVAELTHDEDPGDALVAAERLAVSMRALGARKHGFPVLAALRPLTANLERLAFTRLALPPPTPDADPSPEALVSTMYERASAMPEAYSVAQTFAFASGGSAGGAELDEVEAHREPQRSGIHRESEAAPPAQVEESGAHRSLESLIAEATRAGQWQRVLELRRERLAALEAPKQRVRELITIARILQAELGLAEGAIDALEQAREIDPKRIGVLQALRRGYETLGQWDSATEVMGALAELTPSPSERAALRFAQARIALDQLRDEEQGAAWLQAVLQDDPTHTEALAALSLLQKPRGEPDIDTRERLAERLLAEGADDGALAELESIAAVAPERASVYAKTFAAQWRGGKTDAALLAALALEELDAADVDQQMLIDQFRSVGPIRVRASLDAAAWESLRAPGSDDVLASLFAAVERAAVAVRLEELREQRKLVTFDSAEKLSETSTASIVRSFYWAARVLAIGCPDLYLLDDGSDGISAVPARAPSTTLGPAVLSGLSAKDLAFLAGRHLTYYRPEYHVLVYYSTRDELTPLLFAAAQLAMPEATAHLAGTSIRTLRTRLARHMRDEDHAVLKDAVRRLDARGGRAALGAWMRSAELTAARAGLLLCGDLATATGLVRSESRTKAPLSTEEKRGDLIAFCASRVHAALRARFAMTAPESVRPAPPPSGVHAVEF